MNIQNQIEILNNLLQHMGDLDPQQSVQQTLDINEQEFKIIQESKTKLKGSVCQKGFKMGELGYQCYDCSSNENHIYCQKCFEFDKHINHLATYVYVDEGCCDCGNEMVMKKDSFCDDHQSSTQKTQLNENIHIRQFVQISFALLFNKIEQIVDYPQKFKEQVYNCLDEIDDQELIDLIENQKDQLIKYEQLNEEIQKLYKLICVVFKTIIQENISLSLLTSQYLQQPIDKEIQEVIQLHHNHQNNQIEITQQQQHCNCSILELYVKFNSFISQVIPENEQHFPEIFYSLRIDDTFNPFLWQLMVQNFDLLYLPIKKYKCFTTNQYSFKITINEQHYSEETVISQMFQSIIKNNKIQKIIIRNGLLQAELFKYFRQIAQLVSFQSLKLQKELNQNKFYSYFKTFPKKIKDIPVCYKSTLQLAFNFYIHILYVLTTQEDCSQQISLMKLDQLFEQAVSPSSEFFQRLQKNSLYIYILTRAWPFSTYQMSENNNQDKDNYYINFLQIAKTSFSVFRTVFFSLVKGQQENSKNYKSYEISFKNIMRIILNYLFKKYHTFFQIHPKEPLRSLLNNQILCDRNLILVLSKYLQNFNDPKEAYDDLLSLYENTSYQFPQFMLNVLRRALLNYHIFQTQDNNKYYKGREWKRFELAKISDTPLEQVDTAFIQMYVYIFGADGLNDIIKESQSIGSTLNLTIDVVGLIIRISQSDYDLIQCQAINQGEKLAEQTIKGLNKLFQTIFFAQKSYIAKDLIQLLRELNYDTNFDIQNAIFSSLKLNLDNTLELKESALPAQYEPVFSQLIPSLKDKINNKLRKENDSFQLLFGSSLAHELSNTNSTLTFIRQAILKAIVQDNEQIILNDILKNIQQHYNFNEPQSLNLKLIESILKEKAVYINLLFQSNKAYGPNKVIQDGLQQLLSVNQEIFKQNNLQTQESVFFNYILLLDQSSKFDTFHKEIYQELKQVQEINDQQQIGENEQQGDELCSFCKLDFKQNNQRSKAVLIQLRNIQNYIQVKIQNKLDYDILQYDISFCGHLFHADCLKKNVKSEINFGEQSYYECPVCQMPYNFVFQNPMDMKTFKNKDLFQEIDNYLKNVSKNINLKYLDKYISDNALQVSLVVNELFTSCLCDLLMKMLGNSQDFYFQKYHLLLQEVIHLLRLTYLENQQSILEIAKLNTNQNEPNQIHIGILNAVQQFFIASDSINEFKLYLSQILDNNQQQIVFDLITKQKIDDNLSLQNHQLQFKLNDQLQNFLPDNFRQFFVKYNLTPCGKKKCKLRPIQRINGQEQEQYFCLICLKKMCSHHCSKLQEGDGNLIRHAIKKHSSKSIYLKIRSSEILIVAAPQIYICPQTLYQNLLGLSPVGTYGSSYFENFNIIQQMQIASKKIGPNEINLYHQTHYLNLLSLSPVVGLYGTSKYENFILNRKVVQMIVDVIQGEKYLQQIFQNKSKIARKNL